MGTIYYKQRKNKKIKETWNPRYNYQTKLHKDCFQHDISYGDLKDLNRRTAADKLLRDKAFNIAKNSKYDECQRRLSSDLFFDL